MRDLLTPDQARQQFEVLLAYTSAGNVPPSDTGLAGEVEEALLNIVTGAGTVEEARSVFNDLYSN